MFFLYESPVHFSFSSFENGCIHRFSTIQASQNLNVVKLTVEIINAISHEESLAALAFHYLFTHYEDGPL